MNFIYKKQENEKFIRKIRTEFFNFLTVKLEIGNWKLFVFFLYKNGTLVCTFLLQGI